MKKTKKILSVILAVTFIANIFVACSIEKRSKIELKEVYEYVFDVGTIKSLDYDYAEEWFKNNYDNYGGGCTAVAKVNDAGDTIIGRNMDLNISNKAAYILRTDVKDCYKTVGLMYTFRDYAPDYKDVKENGLPEEFSKVLPFLSDDVLNEKGLYVEVNMRNGEFWPDGKAKFSCSGTNPNSDERVYMFALPRYIGEHCATVDEALEYVKGLDVYSQDGYWNYCFIIADKTGRYGLLEFAQNKVLWHEGQQAQANFYVDKEMNEIESFKTGIGRYNKVMEGIDAVKTEDDMFKLMDSVSYFQVYDIENCQFDYRSENVGALSYATNDFVMDKENQKIIEAVMKENGAYVRSLTRQQLRDANEFWESAFTEVVNCNKRTLFVRFYEDDKKTFTLTFDE